MTRIGQDNLDASVKEGIISAEQAEALKLQATGHPTPDEEPLNIVNNFGDVFIVIGLVMMMSAARAFAAFATPGTDFWIYSAFAVGYWVLAELFMKAKQRRLALTAAAALFAYMAFLAVSALFGQTSLYNAMIDRAVLPALAGLVGALALAYARFRPPVLILFLTLSATALVFQTVRFYWADAPALWVLGGCGVAVLLTGIILDMQDTNRTSNWNDAALWLFIVGSPLTIHPLFLNILWDKVEDFQNQDLNMTIVLVCGLALAISLLGIILDRRSLVASSLVYLSVSLGYTLFKQSSSVTLIAGLVPLIIGLTVIILGVAWHPLRRSLLQALPLGGLRSYLPK